MHEDIFKLCLCTFFVRSNYAMKGKDFVTKKLKIKLKHDILDLETCYLIKDSAISVNMSVWSSNGNLLVLTSKSNNTTFFCNNLVQTYSWAFVCRILGHGK